jgi:hypothetical protein
VGDGLPVSGLGRVRLGGCLSDGVEGRWKDGGRKSDGLQFRVLLILPWFARASVAGYQVGSNDPLCHWSIIRQDPRYFGTFSNHA